MTNSSFSLRLKEERKRLKLTQASAAETAGVARETWSRYETGALAPGMEVLASLAVNGADVTYILTGERVSEWERDVLARTAEVVSKLEPAGDGPISQKMLDAYKLTPARQKTRKNKYKDLEVMLDRCSDDDLAMVMNLASRLSAERNPA